LSYAANKQTNKKHGSKHYLCQALAKVILCDVARQNQRRFAVTLTG